MLTVLVAGVLLLAVAAVIILSLVVRAYRNVMERCVVGVPSILGNSSAGLWLLWQAEWLQYSYFIRSGRFPQVRGIVVLVRGIAERLAGLLMNRRGRDLTHMDGAEPSMSSLLSKHEPRFSLRKTMTILRSSLNEEGEYRSQIGQDYLLNRWFFKDHRGGVFVDVGAYDGVAGSNSYFFEKSLGWKGIAVEPQPQAYRKLIKSRRCKAINACAYDSVGSIEFRQLVIPDEPKRDHLCNARLPPMLALRLSGVHNGEQLSGITSHFTDAHSTRMDATLVDFQARYETHTVRCIRLTDVLEENGLWVVDYLSIDVEGAELNVLNGLDLDRFHTNIISIERSARFREVRDVLDRAGFEHAGVLFWDDIYVNRSLTFSWER